LHKLAKLPASVLREDFTITSPEEFYMRGFLAAPRFVFDIQETTINRFCGATCHMFHGHSKIQVSITAAPKRAKAQECPRSSPRNSTAGNAPYFVAVSVVYSFSAGLLSPPAPGSASDVSLLDGVEVTAPVSELA
jgi:hypothetical protein